MLIRIIRALYGKFKTYKSGGTYDYEYVLRMKRLIEHGLKLGKNVTIETGVFIDGGYPYLISIGDNCSLANGVRLLAHDDSPYKFTDDYARLGKIEIRENCFIGENCIILPGVTIGPNVLLAAGSVVNKDIPPNSCVAGVPARFYAKFDEFIAHQKQKVKGRPIFKYSDLRGGNCNKELRNKVMEAAKNDICYVQGKEGSKYSYIIWNKE